MGWAVRAAFFICCTLYSASAVAGYVLFLDETKGNILDNFDTSLGGWFKISPYIKLIYGALLCVSYPTMSYSGVRSLHRLLFEVRTVILPGFVRKFMFGDDDDEDSKSRFRELASSSWLYVRSKWHHRRFQHAHRCDVRTGHYRV